MKNKKIGYLIGLLVLLVLFILGILVEKYLITIASLLLMGICAFLIRDILKTRGLDPKLLYENERRNLITSFKLSILVSMPFFIPIIFINSQIFAQNEWFIPISFLSNALVFIIIDTIIYIYYFKYLLKKRKSERQNL